MTLELRPAQARVLEYVSGPLAISAVPGAGKTFILTQLARRLVQELGVPPRQILILTYMRSAAATFRARIAQALAEHGLTAYGLQAMTIHAFSLAVLKRHHQTRGDRAEGERPLEVLTEVEQERILVLGLRRFLEDPERRAAWEARLPATRGERDPEVDSARAIRQLISAAKHHRLPVARVEALLGELQPEVPFVYRHYLEVQDQEGLVDFDDQIQQAIHLLRTEPELLEHFHRRYTHVLEDEAQDSTPAQHELIGLLTDRAWGGTGNLVRVGDPNQAITTTFTFNDPRYFRDFGAALEGAGRHVRMDESSRSATPILRLANALVTFAATHPEPGVARAFAAQAIRSASGGRTNPEPLGEPTFTIHPSHDAERDAVLAMVAAFFRARPDGTAAVLLYSHRQVNEYAERARGMGIPLFEGGLRQLASNTVLRVMGRWLEVLAHGKPPDRVLRELVEDWLHHRGAMLAAAPACRRFLGRIRLHELVYPEFELPPTRPRELDEGDYAAILAVAAVWRRMLDARHLSAEELLPLVAEDFFQEPEAPLIAAKALRVARRTMALAPARTDNPWGALREEFHRLASASTRELLGADPTMARPRGGELQIMTMHAAKGAEFEAVWLPGLGRNRFNGHDFPWLLSEAYLHDARGLMARAVLARGAREAVPSRPELELAAKVELIAERLRLLYVGITRAERALHLSCAARPGAAPVAPEQVLELGWRLARQEA